MYFLYMLKLKGTCIKRIFQFNIEYNNFIMYQEFLYKYLYH